MKKISEEINRRLIDQLSNILFPPTYIDVNNIKKENLFNKKVYKVGNTISDIIKSYLPQIKRNKILKKLKLKKEILFGYSS